MARVQLATDQGYRTVTAELSAADIADLHATPIELAPAPGVGKAYQVLGLIYSFHWVSTGYTSADGRLLVGARAAVMADYSVWETEPEGCLASALGASGLSFMAVVPGNDFPDGDRVVEIQMNGQSALMPPALLDNEPLAIGNPNTDLVGGDGTLKVTVRYTTFDL